MGFSRYKPVLKYALYDAGNSNYITLIPSIIFPVYFRQVLAPDSARMDLLWGVTIVVPTLLAALLGPKVGRIADHHGAKFRLLRYFSLATIAGTVLLPFARGPVAVPIALFILTHTCFLLATVLYDAALADVSSREDAAAISSFAWGVGYAGGVVGLLLALAVPKDGPGKFTWCFLISAALFLMLAFPLMLRRDAPLTPRPPRERDSGWAAVAEFMRAPSRLRMFVAYFLYSNGISAVIYFTSLYATGTMGYSLTQLLWLFVAMNAVAAPAAILFGRAAERFGQMRTLRVVIGAWIVAVVAIALAAGPAFAVVACCAAALLGPAQAVSRSLFRVIFPEREMSSFFGVQALASRSSALVGPLLFGVVSSFTGSQRTGALSAAVLFALGLVALLTVPGDVESRSERES